MILNIIVYTFIFFVSVIPIKGMCNVYYGVLRGSQIVKYKSPFQALLTYLIYLKVIFLTLNVHYFLSIIMNTFLRETL